MPFKINLIHTFKADNYTEAEMKLHNIYKEKRKEGEWFVLELTDLIELKKIIEYKNETFVV